MQQPQSTDTDINVICVSCDVNAASNESSITDTDCKCNIGFTGVDGCVCSNCVAGTYKASVGSHICAQCEVGTYSSITAASACIPCHGHATSPVASTMSSACLCEAGRPSSVFRSACRAVPRICVSACRALLCTFLGFV